MKNVTLNWLKPEFVFLVFASLFGLLVLFLTPPFQGADEVNHFYRAYQISEGKFITQKQNNRIGGEVPESLVAFTKPFTDLRWSIHHKTNYETIKQQAQIALEPEKKLFVDFPNTGMYAPTSYLPQALSLFIFRQLNLSPFYLFYGARLFALLFWIAGIFYAIKTIPFYKWLFVLLALLPTSVFVNASLNADMMTNLLSFVLIAYLLRLAFYEEAVTNKKVFIATLLAVLLASCKTVYTPIVLLFLLIPKRKFSDSKNYYAGLMLFFFASFGMALLWSNIMNKLYTPYNLYNPQYRNGIDLVSCADMSEQIHYIKNHGFYLFDVFVNSLKQAFDMYFEGYIGTFGWVETKLPLWFIYTAYSVILIVAVLDKNKNIVLKPIHKITIAVCLIAVVCLVLLSQHLTWDCVGGDIIATISGRYFIPAFPLLFMLFYNSKLNTTGLLIPLILLFSFFGLSFTGYTLYKRYYVLPKFNTISIKCDAEKVNHNHDFETNLPNVFLGNGDTRSKEKAHSGAYSAKLSPQNQFAYSYRLHDCQYGDIITVEVWRFGKGGDLVIAGKKNEFYISNSKIIEKDSSGWEHLYLDFTVHRYLYNREIGIYIFNNSDTVSYFDDMSISYKKVQ